jgi:hydroxymethylglutaryl-CoA lyase
MTRRIDIVEVGPRDGLQNDPSELSAAQKLEFIARLEACGVRRIEAGAFVSPRAVPKMADSGEVFRGLTKTQGRSRIALALNEKGIRYAIDAQADEINFVLVASEGFGLKNQGMSPQQSADKLAELAPMVHAAGIPLSATISVAFGDPYTGEVDPRCVQFGGAGPAGSRGRGRPWRYDWGSDAVGRARNDRTCAHRSA